MSDLNRFDCKADGDKVIASFNRRVYVVLTPKAALEIAKALTAAAKQAEEVQNAGQIITDSAILMRAGAPFTLSSNPKILDAARSAAAWDRDLRRFMPGGVKSEAVVGTPTLIQEKPNGKD